MAIVVLREDVIKMQPEDFGNVLDTLMELKNEIMFILIESQTIESQLKLKKKLTTFSDGLTIGYNRGAVSGLKQAIDIIDDKVAYLYQEIEDIEKELDDAD